MKNNVDFHKHVIHLLTHALTGEGELVFVDDVKTGRDCGCFCPACKEPLVAKNNGKIKAHHFAHQSGTECNFAYESMLHLLAKKKIQEFFLKSKEFNLEFDYISYCPKKKTCRYVKYSNCHSITRRQFNLKLFYDQCDQEVAYDRIRRRSDLKLYSSLNPDRKPIYIEFCVTHASEESKLHSGAKIIECRIESEQDISNILEKGFIQTYKPHNQYSDEPDENKTHIYGFKDSDYSNLQIHCQIEFSRYVLYQSGKTRCFQDYCDCKNITKSSPYSLCEILFHTPCAFGIYDIAKYLGYSKHPIANCMLCRNYVESYNGTGKICRMYKYLQIPQNEDHDTSRAKTCHRYIFNQDEYNEVMSDECSIPPHDFL